MCILPFQGQVYFAKGGRVQIRWLAAAAICFAVTPYTVARGDDGIPQKDMIALLLRDGEEALAKNRFAEAGARFSEALQADWNLVRAYDLLQETRRVRLQTLKAWERGAHHAERQQDWATARALYSRILEADSTRGELRDRLLRVDRGENAADFVRAGLQKFIADDFAGAQLDFEQAIAINPGDTVAADYLNRVRQKIAVSGDALAVIQADAGSWSQYLEALKRLRNGDLPAAEHIWTELLVKYPSNTSILSNLEQVRRRLGRDGAVASDQ